PGLLAWACFARGRAAVAPNLPEVTFLPLPEEDGLPASNAGDVVSRVLSDYDAVLIGPGLGLADNTQALVRGLLSSPAAATIPMVIDADALNALSRQPAWHEN